MKRILFSIVLSFVFASGINAQWSDNPMVNTQVSSLATEQAIPKVAVGPNGDYYVGFFSIESGNYGVRLQRYDFQGNVQWATNGILVSNHPSMTWLTDWDMTVDHNNHAILTWQDIRTGNNNVVAYRISPSGEFTWGANGILLSNSNSFDVSPKVTVTAANNAVFAWQSDNVVIIQKLNPAGTKQWGENGITLSSANRYAWPQLMPVGSDDIILKFFEDSGPVNAPTRHILAQRFNASGSPVWMGNTVITNAGGIKAWTQILSMVNDGNDGFYISWHEDRNFTNRDSPYVQYVNAAGQVQFTPNGVLLATDSQNNHFYTFLARPDNDDHAYIFWRKTDANQNQWGIYAQKVDQQGNLLWANTGKAIIPIGSTAVNPDHVYSLEDEMVLIYNQATGGNNSSIKAMRIKTNGEPAWPQTSVDVSSFPSGKMHYDVAALHNNQMVCAWGDSRSGNGDIYAQNLLTDGSLGPAASPGFISGLVTFTAGTADVGLTSISAGGTSVYPDSDGYYSIQLDPGTYTLTAEHPYTNPITVEDVEVTAALVTEVDIELEVVRADLLVYATDQYGWSVYPVEVLLEGPDVLLEGTIEGEYLMFENQPYGDYSGSATFLDNDAIATATINGENNEITFVFVLLGQNEHSENQGFRLYPNPLETRGQLCITVPETALYQLELRNLNSGIVFHSVELKLQTGSNSLNGEELGLTDELSPGLYLIHIAGEKHNAVLKLILKQRN